MKPSVIWNNLYTGSNGIAPSVGSAAVDGLLLLPAYLLKTLSGGAEIFGS